MAGQWVVKIMAAVKPQLLHVFRPAPPALDAMGEQHGEPSAAANTLLPGPQPQRHELVRRANRYSAHSPTQEGSAVVNESVDLTYFTDEFKISYIISVLIRAVLDGNRIKLDLKH